MARSVPFRKENLAVISAKVEAECIFCARKIRALPGVPAICSKCDAAAPRCICGSPSLPRPDCQQCGGKGLLTKGKASVNCGVCGDGPCAKCVIRWFLLRERPPERIGQCEGCEGREKILDHIHGFCSRCRLELG